MSLSPLTRLATTLSALLFTATLALAAPAPPPAPAAPGAVVPGGAPAGLQSLLGKPGMKPIEPSDTFENLLKKAETQFKAGKLVETKRLLDEAQVIISRQRGSALEKFMPAAPANFVSEPQESRLPFAFMLPAAAPTVVRRLYKSKTDKNSSFTITLNADSEQMQTIFAAMSSPQARNPGVTPTTIKSQQAVIESSERAQKVTVSIAERALLVISSNRPQTITSEFLKTVAESVDYAGLSAALK